MPTKLTIGRVAYDVEPGEFPGVNGKESGYDLRGPRGAHYRTCRNAVFPDRMFLVHVKRFGVALDGTWLSDKDGTLKVLK